MSNDLYFNFGRPDPTDVVPSIDSPPTDEVHDATGHNENDNVQDNDTTGNDAVFENTADMDNDFNEEFDAEFAAEFNSNEQSMFDFDPLEWPDNVSLDQSYSETPTDLEAVATNPETSLGQALSRVLDAIEQEKQCS